MSNLMNPEILTMAVGERGKWSQLMSCTTEETVRDYVDWKWLCQKMSIHMSAKQ